LGSGGLTRATTRPCLFERSQRDKQFGIVLYSAL
jgi:hypothetical protein